MADADAVVADAVAVADAVKDVAEDETVVATTSYAPTPDTATTCPISKDGEENAASADIPIAMNGVPPAASTSTTTALTVDTVWTATTSMRYGPTEHSSQQVVALATATSSSALAEDVGWNPI